MIQYKFLIEELLFNVNLVKVQISFDVWGRVYISIYEVERGSPRTFKVSIYMRGIVDFSTDLEYIEYFPS